MYFGQLMADFEEGVLNVSCPSADSSDVGRELEEQAPEQERSAAEDLSASSALFLPLFPAYPWRQQETVTLHDSGSELIAPKVVCRHKLIMCITSQGSLRLF